MFAFILYTGTGSYKNPIDFQVWAYSYLEFAYHAPPFYPKEFDAAATAVFQQMNISQQNVTFTTAKALYLHLVNIMSS